MPNFIISRSGGGKTTYVMNSIKTLSECGKRSLLIVPEQFSFTAEKALILNCGEKAAAQVDVLSFTALAEKIAESSGFNKNPLLNPASAGVIMSFALNDIKDELILYGKHASNKNTAKEFVSLISEFKQNAVSADNIAQAISKMPDSLLKAKLGDIEKIIRAYDERIGKSYFDPDDLLTAITKTAELDSFIKGKTVFIDSFRGFTAQEYAVIEHLIKYADNVYVALCSHYDSGVYSSDYNITEPFAKTKKTAERLISIAEKAGVGHPVAGSDKNIIFTSKDNRYAGEDLEHLEKAFALDTETEFEGECKNIILCRAPDIYSECAFAAATAKKLLREKNLRCRDIAVIARKIDKYEKPLKSALKKCGIPVYEDFRKPVDASPVINTVTSALSAASDNFSNDSMMRYIKSGLSGLTNEEASLVENYCFVWNIKGKRWLEEWKSNPDGFGETDEAVEERLVLLNSLRKRIVKPIIDLKNSIGEEIDGFEAVKAVWDFIEKINLRDEIRSAAEIMISDGNEGAAFELERMWNILIKSLDELATLLNGEKVGIRKLSDSMEIMFSSQTLGNLPQGLDEIVIGSADRMRIIAPKIAFIIGANEGVFPPEAVLVSALTTKDRNRMAQYGIELSDSPEWKIADENLIAYSSLCCPREFLAVTCTDSAADGSALNPGPFYKKIKKIFPDIKEYSSTDLGHLYFTEGLQPAFEELAKSNDSEYKETITEYFDNMPEYRGRLKALENATGIRNFNIEDRSVSEKLYKQPIYLSASKIEKFYQCPFSYFCNYGLKLNKLNEAKLDQLQIGNITHSVLENLLKDPGVDVLIEKSDGELREMISAAADTYLEDYTQSGIDSERFNYRFTVLKRVIFDILKRICDEFSQSDFRPEDFELLIGSDDIPAYRPEGSDGNISIGGYVDRVDIAVSKTTGKKYYRVVDYKTGSKEFRLSDILNGINLQMLIYMFALESKDAVKYSGYKPAGVLYYKANSKIVKEEDADKASGIDRMDGVVLDDENVIRMMENGAEGKFIHASVKDGKIDGLVLTDDEFDIIKSKTDFFITDMVRSLRNGNISALPKVSDDKKKYGKAPCKFCDFKYICRYEDDIEMNVYKNRKDEVERISLHEEVNPGE